MPPRRGSTPSSDSESPYDSEPESVEDEEEDLVATAVSEAVEEVRVALRMKPQPVRTYLSNSYYQMLKKEGGDLKCVICLDEIDCPNCFELWSCGHFLHRHCSVQLKKLKCPQCN